MVLEGNVVISNSAKDQRSYAFSLQRCYFSLIVVKLRWIMIHLSSCQNCKNIILWKFRIIVLKIFFSKLYCFMGSFRKSVSKLGMSCFNQSSLVILSPTLVQSRSGSEYTVNTLNCNWFLITLFVLIAVWAKTENDMYCSFSLQYYLLLSLYFAGFEEFIKVCPFGSVCELIEFTWYYIRT